MFNQEVVFYVLIGRVVYLSTETNKVTKGGNKNTERGINVIFTRLNIDHENNFIEISVNEPFVFLLNEQSIQD